MNMWRATVTRVVSGKAYVKGLEWMNGMEIGPLDVCITGLAAGDRVLVTEAGDTDDLLVLTKIL